jgi:predicted TIM-barrel fold metal-dependent hydrolase
MTIRDRAGLILRGKRVMADNRSSSRNYVLINSDGHAGASIGDYKPYLARELHEEFDAWAKDFHDPWADFDKELADTDDEGLRIGVSSASSPYNWESEERVTILEGQGTVAEVIYPNTVPPFYPSGAVTAPSPTNAVEYRRLWAGVQAHNRWLVDFCNKAPGRRAGLAQVFLTNLDDAIAEVRWAKEQGLAGVIVPSDHQLSIVNLYERRLDRFWKACCDIGMPVHRHAASVGPPETEETGPAAIAVGVYETATFMQRTLSHLMFGGVFERFPDLQFVMTEIGCAWIPEELKRLDGSVLMGRRKGTIAYPLYHRAVEGMVTLPSEHWRKNMHIAPSLLVRKDLDVRHQLGVDRIMWGSDYPHKEASFPYSWAALRGSFAGVPHDEVAAMLGGNAAALYGFDLDLLAPIAAAVGPRVSDVDVPLEPGDVPLVAEKCPALAGFGARD